MTTYNPHTQLDMIDEMDVAGRGRLVKVRFPDQPVPNVSWFWIPLGNCFACAHYAPPQECLNPDIPDDDFNTRYLVASNCPGYEVGVSKQALNEDDVWRRREDVMKAAGLCDGVPSQRVDIIVNEPWSIATAQRAHRESSIFLDMAQMADYVRNGGENDPHTLEYVDLSDDLEPKARP